VGYAFAIFFLIFVLCFVAAVVAEKISSGIHRVQNTSKEELGMQAREPRKLSLLTRIVAWTGTLVGGTVAFFFADDAAM
tara:strand:- start:136 stop:372 length:237 start_codon:yes stop_codon:yes gene_type:complete